MPTREADAIDGELLRLLSWSDIFDLCAPLCQVQSERDRALTYTQRALKILTDHYGADNPGTRTVAANLKRLEEAKEAQQHQP